MATTTATVAPNNATAAEFRAWAQFIHDVFVNGSWVQTGDTGQINLATVAAPGAANTKMGYEILRMDDALQSTNPVFLKLAYGSGSSTNFPAIWFMIGTATDGAGNLIDANDANRAAYLADFYSQTVAPIHSRSNSATTHICFGSATTSRAVFAIFEAKPTLQFTGSACEFVNVTGPDTASPGNFINAFAIERGRDENGDLVGNHLVVMWTGTSVNGVFIGHLHLRTSDQYVISASVFGTVSARPPGTSAIYAQYKASLMPADGEAAAYAIIPFEGTTKPGWPGINLLVSPNPLFDFDDDPGNCNVAFNSNYISGRTASVDPYGVARTYRTVAGLRGGAHSVTSADAGAFIWMLYE